MGAISTLMPAGPAANDHARRLLSRQGLEIERVVSIDEDSILYVSSLGRPRTAWLLLDERGLLIQDEPGFSADEPPPPA